MRSLVRQARYLWGLKNYSRRARIRFIVEYAISECYEEIPYQRGWPDWTYAPQWGVLDRIGRVSCSVFGHDPTSDHCGMPAHDYCQVCQTLTPGAAPRRTDGATR